MTEESNLAIADPMKMDEQGLYVVRDQMDEKRIALNLLRTGAAPASFRTAEQVMVALQALKSLQLNPLTGLRQTGFINGSFTLYGDLPLARVRQSSDLELFEEFPYVKQDGKNVRQCFSNNNEDMETYGYCCRVKRCGMPLKEVCFSQAHAKRAGLWRPSGSSSPWNKYPDKMLKYRARSEALKDCFGDWLAGVGIAEYDEMAPERIPTQVANTSDAIADKLEAKAAAAAAKPGETIVRQHKRRGRPPKLRQVDIEDAEIQDANRSAEGNDGVPPAPAVDPAEHMPPDHDSWADYDDQGPE